MRVIVLAFLVTLLAACGQSVFDLEVGMCFNGAIDESSSVETVDCTEPHDSEVYALLDYADADVFPGQEVLSQYAEDQCVSAFEDYVGVPYEQSEIFAGTGYPSSETWDNGDREIVCSLNAETGQLTGSMMGANR